MMPPSTFITDKKIFGLSILLGIILILSLAAYDKWKNHPSIKINNLVHDVAVTEQLTRKDILYLDQDQFKTIIDLRPDGEATDQLTSSEVESLANANKFAFVYVPVPHGDIPDSAVDALASALSNNPKPILMYCRSGKRAARTWSLVEASRVDGLDANAILSAVKRSGQSADDLEVLIKQRIANRRESAAK